MNTGLPPGCREAAGRRVLRSSNRQAVINASFSTLEPRIQLRRYIKFLTSGSRGWGDYYADHGERFLRIGNLSRVNLEIGGDIQFVNLPADVTEGSRTMLQEGDLLFSITAYLGSVAVVTGDWVGAYVSQHVALCRLDRDQVDPRFIGWFMLTTTGQDQLNGSAAGGTKMQLALDDIRGLRIPAAPIEEQRRIAAYLDRETARIDMLIEEQQRLTELLRERRNAVVDRALSHGLDVELVRTGDPWLPILPVGWTAVATKRLLSFGPSNGVSPEAGSVGDLRTLSLGAVRDGRVSIGPDVTKFVDRAAVPRLNDLRLRAGDILLVRGNGNVNLVGRAGLVGPEFDDEEYIYPDLLIRIRVGASMLPEFFVWAFNSAATRAQIGTRARTAVGTYKVASSDVRAIVLPVPPLSEQARIVAYLGEHGG